MPTSLCFLSLLTLGLAQPLPEGVRVALVTRATLATDEVTLGQVAAITASGDLATALGAVSLGSAPVPGQTRTIEAGYVRLRLKRYGFDPAQLALSGATVVVAREGPATTTGPAPAAGQPSPTLRRNDTVTVAVRCGGVMVSVEGRVVSLNPSGETALVFLPQTGRTVPTRVLGPRQAALDVHGGN